MVVGIGIGSVFTKERRAEREDGIAQAGFEFAREVVVEAAEGEFDPGAGSILRGKGFGEGGFGIGGALRIAGGEGAGFGVFLRLGGQLGRRGHGLAQEAAILAEATRGEAEFSE